MSLRAIGEVVEVVSRPWAMDGRSGVSNRIKVQTSRSVVTSLKIAENVRVPRDGEIVDLLVEPRLSEGEGRRASMTMTVVGEYEAPSESSGRRASAAAA